MSRKKISTTIYVTPEQSDRLRLLHERTKVPVAVYIREGIDLVLRHYDHLLPGQLPLGAGRAAEDGGPLGIGERGPSSSESPSPPSVAETKPERAAGAGKG